MSKGKRPIGRKFKSIEVLTFNLRETSSAIKIVATIVKFVNSRAGFRISPFGVGAFCRGASLAFEAHKGRPD